MNLNELKTEYRNTLDNLLYTLQCNKENTTYTKEETEGYQCCINDVRKYFKDILGVEL